MDYADGGKVKLGDKVTFGGGLEGTIICCFDTKEYLPDFEYESFTDVCKSGVMIETPRGGLVHYSYPDYDLILLNRADSES
ncbi:hypothetical protein BGI40_08835 [Snodgrassella communis]|uniref:hypothetical protein n=1 Tax=Snodgrassella communis TaxID=2946699 RepID=UPI00055EDCBA|nr:hypothetical protein [Snodgrassella communis]PIT09918.1 hypothetical protein BGI29_03705 [Snodgrassella communis]PIT27975.1 hypothetical protein BGI38_05230 [Snodgrassella communis]PIT30330.1 hypothetical protein BGI39_00935 [Snodgrassella communis]PIT32379.1 hypothetical protein BGI40_08835 [Snodgrassella communis]